MRDDEPSLTESRAWSLVDKGLGAAKCSLLGGRVGEEALEGEKPSSICSFGIGSMAKEQYDEDRQKTERALASEEFNRPRVTEGNEGAMRECQRAQKIWVCVVAKKFSTDTSKEKHQKKIARCCYFWFCAYLVYKILVILFL